MVIRLIEKNHKSSQTSISIDCVNFIQRHQPTNNQTVILIYKKFVYSNNEFSVDTNKFNVLIFHQIVLNNILIS